MLKSIEIDEEALARLEAMRVGDESLSSTIKRCVPRKVTAEEIMQVFAKNALSDETLDLIEESSARRRSILRQPSE